MALSHKRGVPSGRGPKRIEATTSPGPSAVGRQPHGSAQSRNLSADISGHRRAGNSGVCVPPVGSAGARAMVANPAYSIPCTGIPNILAEHLANACTGLVLDMLNGGQAVLAPRTQRNNAT